LLVVLGVVLLVVLGVVFLVVLGGRYIGGYVLRLISELSLISGLVVFGRLSSVIF